MISKNITSLLLFFLILVSFGTTAQCATDDILIIAKETGTEEKANEKTQISTTIYLTVTENNVRFRDKPSTDSKILKEFKKAQIVELISENNGWAYVLVDSTNGYISMLYLEKFDTSKTAIVDIKQTVNTNKFNADKSKFTIAIDAGHQGKGNSEKELIGPGATTSKAKVASGTSGVSSKQPEYQLTLDVSLKLQEELVSRGFKVFMVRESNDVNISNRERAENSAEAGADILVRIHANGSSNQNDNGILTISPTSKNVYVKTIYKESRNLSDSILERLVEATKAKNKGVWETDTMSGINWSTIPVTIVEMGFMTNPKEDKLMQTDDYQNKIINGIANGVDDYFSTLGTAK